jgi:class 3 adenylate cyclase/pimeloyl-ACP methyl ester carboxylesterase
VRVAATVQYARNGDVHLAYQLIGDGSHDVLLLAGGTMPMDALGEHAKGLEVLFGLQRLGRLILTDQRGIGQSDRTESGFTPENEADDLAVVLDAADARDCLLVACFDASLAALALAARNADRLGSLVLVNGFPRFRPSYGDLEQLPPDALQTFHEILDGGGAEEDILAFAAPSERDDDRFRAWFDDSGRRGASPTTASRRWSAHESADVTSYLADIALPTLILHRAGNLIVSPRQAAVLAQGIPGAQLVLLPGQDNLVYAGSVHDVTNAIAQFAGGPADAAVTRVLTTILFTDIVGSTNRAVGLGDRRWTTALDIHDAIAMRIVDRHGGTLVNTTGDGLLVTFDGPGNALRCGSDLRDALADAGIEIRTGVHVGEVELRGADIGGIAVHLAARVMEIAQAGEVLVSSVVPLLMSGSGTEFHERGEHCLKGIPGTWSVYAANI